MYRNSKIWESEIGEIIINIYVSIVFYHYIASPRLRFCEWILSPGSTLTGHRQGLDTTSALRASEGGKEKRIRLQKPATKSGLFRGILTF